MRIILLLKLIRNEIKAELFRYHDTLKEGYDALGKASIFFRDADDMFLREMASVNLATLQLNKILYPMYHEIQREIKKGYVCDHIESKLQKGSCAKCGSSVASEEKKKNE